MLGTAIAQLLVTRPSLVDTDPATWATVDEHALSQLYADYRDTYSIPSLNPMVA